MKYFIPLIISVLSLASCQLNNKNQSAEKEAIAQVIFDQQNAWNRGDIEGYMQGYAKTDTLRFASGGNVSYGWLPTLERYQEGYPDKETMGKLIFSKIDIQILSDEAALVFGKWELERENDHPWGLFTLLFNKTSKGWKVVYDHTSSGKDE